MVKKICGELCDTMSRIVGYYSNVKQWNRGKREEYKLRKTFDLSLLTPDLEDNNDDEKLDA